MQISNIPKSATALDDDYGTAVARRFHLNVVAASAMSVAAVSLAATGFHAVNCFVQTLRTI